MKKVRGRDLKIGDRYKDDYGVEFIVKELTNPHESKAISSILSQHESAFEERGLLEIYRVTHLDAQFMYLIE